MRWLALSLGIISPGESRLTAVSVFDAMLYFQFSEKRDPSVEEIMQYISSSWGPINEKTLRYHLLQLKRASILDNEKGKYFLIAPSIGNKYEPDQWIASYVDSKVNPIKGKLQFAIKELRSR